MPPLALEAPVRAVFERNRVAGTTPEGVDYRFHCPDADKFPAQFSWDSCWHAVALARIDPAAAREELRTLMRAQEADGFLPHTILWHRRVRASRALIYNFQSARDRSTRTMQPPFEALAWQIVARASADDPGFATEALEALDRRHAWIEQRRDPDGSGLVALISPDESGLDASPKFDRLMGLRAAGRVGFALHVARLRRDRFDLANVVARGGFCVQEVLATTAHALSLRSLAALSGDDRHAERAERVEAALLERCWDPGDGLFYDLAYPSGEPATRRDLGQPRAARAAVAAARDRRPARRADRRSGALRPAVPGAVDLGGRARVRAAYAAYPALLAGLDVDRVLVARAPRARAARLPRSRAQRRASRRAARRGHGRAGVLRPLRRGAAGRAGVRHVDARARPRAQPLLARG